jgi:hypothetical protein
MLMESVMTETTFVITFPKSSLGEANALAQELALEILETAPGVRIVQKRSNPDTQDFGATLVLILAAPAVVMAVRALKSWLTRTNAASVDVLLPNGRLVAKNVESKDVAAVVAALQRAVQQ